MAHGRNNGKKLMAVRIIAHAFEIVSSKPTCKTIRLYLPIPNNGLPRPPS